MSILQILVRIKTPLFFCLLVLLGNVGVNAQEEDISAEEWQYIDYNVHNAAYQYGIDENQIYSDRPFFVQMSCPSIDFFAQLKIQLS